MSRRNWAKDKAVEEVAWVQSVADAHGWPHAIVGYADLLDENVGETLKRQSAFPLMRGIRMQLHWHENEMYRFAPTPDLMNDPALPQEYRAGSPTTAGRSTCRSSPRRWTTPQGSPPTIPTSPSSCSMPACWRTCRRPAAPPGATA